MWKGIEVGDSVTRADVRVEHGGSNQGGIVTALPSSNVLVYSDPEVGERYGYTWDGWVESEGVFLYTGHGPRGDQEIKDRNRTLAHHTDRDLAVRLFTAVGTVPGSKSKLHRYEGEFAIDSDQPYLWEDAPDEDGEMRRVVVFRLRPVGEYGPMFPANIPISGTSGLETSIVSPEADDVRHFVQNAEASERTAERSESKLVKAFEKHLQSLDHEVGRGRIKPPGTTRWLFTDTIDLTTGHLYEAKGSSTREHVRTAIGQLFDYERFVDLDVAAMSLLLPSRPADDLLGLLDSLGIGCVYREADGSFTVSSP